LTRLYSIAVAISNNIYDREGLYTYLLVKQVNVHNNKLDIPFCNNANQGFDPGNFYPAVATLSSKAGNVLDAINVNATVVVN